MCVLELFAILWDSDGQFSQYDLVIIVIFRIEKNIEDYFYGETVVEGKSHFPESEIKQRQ